MCTSLRPCNNWKLFPDMPFAQFAGMVSMLPSSSACVERVWSAMGNHVDGRETLTLDHLYTQGMFKLEEIPVKLL